LESWKRNLYSVWTVVFIGLLGANLVFPFMPFYLQEDLGVDSAGEAAFWTGAMATATGVAMFIFSPIWGSVADRYGRKAMLGRSVLAGGIVIGMQGLVTDVWQLLLLRALMGAFAGTVGAATALVASSTPQREMGFSMGFIQMGRFSSQTAGPVIGGLLAAFLGFRETFFFTALLYFAAFLVVVFVVKEDFQRPEHDEGLRRAPWAVIGRDIAAVAAVPALMFMIVVLYFLFASNAFVRPVVPLVLQDMGDQENIELIAGLVFATLAVTSAVSSIVIGRVTDTLGYRLALTITVVGAGVAYLPVVIVGSPWGLAVLMGAVGLFSGGMLAVTNALIGALSPQGKQGSAFGLASSSQALAMATGPLAGGFAASALGVRAGFPIVAAILISVGVVAWFTIKEPRREESIRPATEPVARS
jgi:DHA1 family multidrug resistance protein-like MFS transporter